MIGTSTSARLLSTALLILVLGVGFLMGMAWNGSEASAGVVEADSTSREPERRTRMIDQVGLDPQQQQEVDRIVEHYRVRMRALDREFQEAYRPRRGEIVRQTRDSLKTVLTPDQVLRYDSLLEARDRERREREQQQEQQRERRQEESRDEAPPGSGNAPGGGGDC